MVWCDFKELFKKRRKQRAPGKNSNGHRKTRERAWDGAQGSNRVESQDWIPLQLVKVTSRHLSGKYLLLLRAWEATEEASPEYSLCRCPIHICIFFFLNDPLGKVSPARALGPLTPGVVGGT